MARFRAMCGILLLLLTQPPPATAQTLLRGRPLPARVQNAATGGAVCLLGSPAYAFTSTAAAPLATPLLIEYDTNVGVVGGGALLSPPVIDLAWGPDFNLYGVTNALAPGANANSLFRIDPDTGAAVRIGGIGRQLARDGDLGTNPVDGQVYGVDGTQVFRFAALTWNSTGSTTQTVATVPLNLHGMAGWELIGLAFDPSGTPFAIARLPGYASTPNARLLKLDPTTFDVQPGAQSNIELAKRFGTHGGLEFSGGRLFFAEATHPGADSTGSTSGSSWDQIYEINPTTGALIGSGAVYSGVDNGLASLVTCRPQLKTCRPPPPDMVAWYPFDQNPNDKVLGLNAVPSTTPQMQYLPPGSGKVDAAASFLNGGYATIPPGPLLNQGLGDFSVDAWVKITAGQTSGNILDKRSYNLGYRGWSFFVSGGHLALQLADGAYTNFYDGRVMSANWHHVAVTIDRDNPQGIIFYIDGQPGAPQNPTARQGSLDAAGPAYIGRHAFQAGTSDLAGLDELELFDRVLKATEVKGLFEADKWGKCK